MILGKETALVSLLHTTIRILIVVLFVALNKVNVGQWLLNEDWIALLFRLDRMQRCQSEWLHFLPLAEGAAWNLRIQSLSCVRFALVKVVLLVGIFLIVTFVLSFFDITGELGV